jgi:hypothetical protein
VPSLKKHGTSRILLALIAKALVVKDTAKYTSTHQMGIEHWLLGVRGTVGRGEVDVRSICWLYVRGVVEHNDTIGRKVKNRNIMQPVITNEAWGASPAQHML